MYNVWSAARTSENASISLYVHLSLNPTHQNGALFSNRTSRRKINTSTYRILAVSITEKIFSSLFHPLVLSNFTHDCSPDLTFIGKWSRDCFAAPGICSTLLPDSLHDEPLDWWTGSRTSLRSTAVDRSEMESSSRSVTISSLGSWLGSPVLRGVWGGATSWISRGTTNECTWKLSWGGRA